MNANHFSNGIDRIVSKIDQMHENRKDLDVKVIQIIKFHPCGPLSNPRVNSNGRNSKCIKNINYTFIYSKPIINFKSILSKK